MGPRPSPDCIRGRHRSGDRGGVARNRSGLRTNSRSLEPRHRGLSLGWAWRIGIPSPSAPDAPPHPYHFVGTLQVVDITEADLDTIASWLRDAHAIVVLTGAGISTDSGIPDFRGPDGVWTKNPAAEKTANLEHYIGDPEVRKLAWQNRLSSDIWSARPNDGHRAVAELARVARVHTLVTQNIDGLHLAAGSDQATLVEIHGTVHFAKCLVCKWRGPMAEILERVRGGEEDPACLECGGMLKSATISFGENLVHEDLERAQRAAADADVFLALGTSLGVYPAAALPEIAVRSGARLVIINGEETPFDGHAAAVSRTPLGEILPALVARVKP